MGDVVQLRGPQQPPAEEGSAGLPALPPSPLAMGQPGLIGTHRAGPGWLIVARTFMCGMPLRQESLFR